MNNLVIPQGYTAPLPNYEQQRAIAFIKESFQTNLSNALNLRRVSAPLFVASDSGLNDNLNGTERPVSFDIPGVGKDAEVVHSLAKWKRLALKRYGFHVGKGLYTDMNAIRPAHGQAPGGDEGHGADRTAHHHPFRREGGAVPEAGGSGRPDRCRHRSRRISENPHLRFSRRRGFILE